MNCPEKIARAIAGLISAKIYLELVCKEEDYQEYLVELEEQLDMQNEKEPKEEKKPKVEKKKVEKKPKVEKPKIAKNKDKKKKENKA